MVSKERMRSPLVRPRLLSKVGAADYCGVSPSRFDKWRREGRMPDPLPGTARWDRADIDAAIEALKRLGRPAVPTEPPVEETDPLAAWIAQRKEKNNASR